jgi:hypothetical protein
MALHSLHVRIRVRASGLCPGAWLGECRKPFGVRDGQLSIREGAEFAQCSHLQPQRSRVEVAVLVKFRLLVALWVSIRGPVRHGGRCSAAEVVTGIGSPAPMGQATRDTSD